MKCERCDGKGFEEFEHGLIMVECDECEGTGEIDDSIGGIGQPINLALCAHGNQPDECQECRKERETEYELEKRIALGGRDDTNTGIGQPDTDIGGENTSKPQQPKKPRKKRKTKARAG